MTDNKINKLRDRSLLEMFILDVLRYDIENVCSILKLLNNWSSVGWREFWEHDFTMEEVIPCLKKLMNDGLVGQLIYDPQTNSAIPPKNHIELLTGQENEELWFELLGKGWSTWERWEDPPISKDQL